MMTNFSSQELIDQPETAAFSRSAARVFPMKAAGETMSGDALVYRSIPEGHQDNEPYILTPDPGPEPVYNGPTIFGVRPGSPLFFRLAVSGSRPMKFTARGLPEGVALHASTGILAGCLQEPSRHLFLLSAENERGQTSFEVELVVGEEIALTPPMGWNSWNAWGEKVSADRVREAARALVETGLADFGWTYVNIDDGWQGHRNACGALQPDPVKFPDMQAVCDEVHAMGLKIGIYSAPWVRTFAGYSGGSSGEGIAHMRDEERGWYVGSEHYEKQDAGQWAQWGIDYLKYDWNPMDLASGRRMAKALRECGRDIVYNVTNSIHKEPPEKWAEISQCFYLWRTIPEDANTGNLLAADIQDDWDMVSNIGFHMNKWRPYVRPGHWNDPDMLVVGAVGWGEPHPSRLTPNEQYTHISLWCLLAAPLLLGCDFLQTRDDFTLSLLKNREVIAVNQDRLGDMGLRLETQNPEGIEVVKKEMADGSAAVGLFNRAEKPQLATLRLVDLGRNGAHSIRDLWRQQDIGQIDTQLIAEVPAHGVVLIRSTPISRP